MLYSCSHDKLSTATIHERQAHWKRLVQANLWNCTSAGAVSQESTFHQGCGKLPWPVLLLAALVKGYQDGRHLLLEGAGLPDICSPGDVERRAAGGEADGEANDEADGEAEGRVDAESVGGAEEEADGDGVWSSAMEASCHKSEGLSAAPEGLFAAPEGLVAAPEGLLAAPD